MGTCQPNFCCKTPKENNNCSDLLIKLQNVSRGDFHMDEKQVLLEQLESLQKHAQNLQSQLDKLNPSTQIDHLENSKSTIPQLEANLSLGLQRSPSSDTWIEDFEINEEVTAKELFRSATLYKAECLQLRDNNLLETYNTHKDKYVTRPMPPTEVFKTIGRLLDSKYESDCADIAHGRVPKPVNEFTLEFFKRNNGLESLFLKKLCEMLFSLEKLHEQGNELAILICRILQIFDEEPVPDQLAWFLTKARADFNKIISKKTDKNCITLGEMIKLVYSLFEKDSYCRGVCFKHLRPECLSVQNYLVFRICHKLLKLGQSADSLFSSIDTDGNGTIERSELQDGIKNLLDLVMQEEDIENLFRAIDMENTGHISKSMFLTCFNFNAYHQYINYEPFSISLCKFLHALVQTYETIQIKDNAIVRAYVKNTGLYSDFESFRLILLKFDPLVNRSAISTYFEEALEHELSKIKKGVVHRDAIRHIILKQNIGGRGIRDFSNL